MSFDVFISSFQEGKFAGFPRQRIRDAFAAKIIEGKSLWQLRFDAENACDVYLTADAADPSMLTSFTVSRPCGDLRLWDALASILASGNLVLCFPGGRAPLVARSTVIQHLPAGMIEALGQPLVITSGEEILREIKSA